ncbi:MAG: SDR family oxidoreductase [Acidimicrobiales bacterium]|nr:SDR family oxidoreductase [Acidimicrobiales bacterium]
MIDLDLTGKRAIVTGASIGIGAATVRLLADHGADVAFCARGEDGVNALAAYRPVGSGSVRGYVADMADAASTDAFLTAVEADLGGADILVNNVGASPSRNFLYMSDEDWEHLHQLNLMSAVRCTRRCLPAMRKQRWGRVIMVATGGAIYPNAALIDYAATKAAMIATGKALAGKYGGDGVLINSVLPGLIHTAMWERAAGEVAAAVGGTTQDVLDRNATTVPVGRYGTAEEVANAIVFLCSNAASYINGVALSVDGGSGGHV